MGAFGQDRIFQAFLGQTREFYIYYNSSRWLTPFDALMGLRLCCMHKFVVG